MNKIEELKLLFIAHKYGAGKLKDCVDWAVERLVNVEENDDWEVVLLAGSTQESEIEELVQNILHRYIDPARMNEELCAGQLLVYLFDRYHENEISITKLESIIYSMFVNLSYPDWLVMLSRNCELGIAANLFKIRPFEDEFKYITVLWREAKSLDDFTKKYDRQISNSHDFDFIKSNKRWE